jgi:hypothetical protein
VRHKLARVGATGVLIAQANLYVYEKAAMRVAEATFLGTAITNFGPPRNARRPLTIMRL